MQHRPAAGSMVAGDPGHSDLRRRLAPHAGRFALGLGLGALSAAFVVYPLAHSFMDRTVPQPWAAGVLHLMLVLSWAAAMVLTPVVQPRRYRFLLIAGLVVAVPFAVLLVDFTESAYGFGGFFAVMFVMGYVYFPLFALAFWALVVAGFTAYKGRKALAVQIVHLVGLMWLGVFAMASFWLLVTLPRQQQLAREAHEVPGMGPVLLLMVLLLIALILRRR